MKNLLLALTFALLPITALSADEKPALNLESHIKMHENMAKAHSDAATCLKAGTKVEECRANFHKACGEGKEEGMCGMKGGKGMHRGM